MMNKINNIHIKQTLHNAIGGGKIVLSTLLLVLFYSTTKGQDADYMGRWFFGIEGGTTFGQCTFRSITDDKTNIGGSAGIFGGYGFNSIFALECAATFGSTKLTAQDCDPFWLSTSEGQSYYASVIDQPGDFYKNITAKPKFSKFALQLDIDLLKIFTEPCSKLSLTVAPQISLVNTKNKLTSDILNQKYDNQTHFGYGAQAAFGFYISQKIQLQIFGDITALSGDRIDNIPENHHESNFIWDGGIKIAYRIGRSCGKNNEPFTDNTVPDNTQPQIADEQQTDTTQTEIQQPDVQQNDIPQPDTTQTQIATVDDTNTQPEPDDVEQNDDQDIKEDEKSTNLLPIIYFADNGLTISQKEYPKFREVVNYLKEHPDTKISIYGYCSKSGTEDYNKYLSQRRAELIKRRLIQSGVSVDRFKDIVGKGVDYAAPDNKSARRVEIISEK